MEKASDKKLGNRNKLENTRTELLNILKGHDLVEGSNSTRIKALNFYKSTVPDLFHFEMYEPSLCLILQGTKAVALGDRELIYSLDHYLLVAISMPLVARIGEASPDLPYLAVIVSLTNSEIARVFSELKLLPSERVETSGLGRGEADVTLFDAALRLVQLLDTPEHIEVLAPLILRELAYRLLVGPQGATLREMVLTNGKMHRLAGAIERMRYQFDQPLRVEILAREAGMSVSSLHYHFKAITSLSPVQYLKQVRLYEARKLILTEQLDVTKAGLQVGYESPSQFSREYRRLFGVAPSQDGRQLRSVSDG